MTTKPKRGAAKLKPCPWCGVVPKTVRFTDEWVASPDSYRWGVACENIQCAIMPEAPSVTRREDAIAEWNTRARRKKQRKGKSTKQPRRIK